MAKRSSKKHRLLARRFVLTTGWIVYILIPLLILFMGYPANAAFAAIYGSLGATVGIAVGFYFYKKDQTDDASTVKPAAETASTPKTEPEQAIEPGGEKANEL